MVLNYGIIQERNASRPVYIYYCIDL